MSDLAHRPCVHAAGESTRLGGTWLADQRSAHIESDATTIPE